MTSTHFARACFEHSSVLDTAMGRTGGAQAVLASGRGVHTTASAHAAIGLPTLGETGVKFNSSRWAQAGAEEGLSIFDTKSAMEALRNGPQESSARRVHPAQVAHAARIARAQQQGLTFYGFKVFPDLTPGRAFMWGSVLAVYTVGVATIVTCRSVGITSVGDVREKMQAAFAPYKAALQDVATSAKGGLTLRERPAVFDQMAAVGANISQTLSKPKVLLNSDELEGEL